MASQILRPTAVKRDKGNWLIQGSWGRRRYPAMSRLALYAEIRRELIEGGVLPADSPLPSSRYHDHVTMTIMGCSWIEDRWVPDESFALRLKRLREQARLTQEQLAEKAGLDVGTVRQLEQGTRTSPLWPTVCALSRGLEKDVVVFVGTEGWQAPEAPAKRRRQVRPSNRAERDAS